MKRGFGRKTLERRRGKVWSCAQVFYQIVILLLLAYAAPMYGIDQEKELFPRVLEVE